MHCNPTLKGAFLKDFSIAFAIFPSGAGGLAQ